MSKQLTILADVPAGATATEITIDALAKRLGLDAETLEAELEKNLTVGDVHVATSLSDVSVAYVQGEDDDGEQEPEAEDAKARKAAEPDFSAQGNVSADDLQAVDMLHGRMARGQSKDYAVRAVCAQCGLTPADLKRAYDAVHGRTRREGDEMKLGKSNDQHDEHGRFAGGGGSSSDGGSGGHLAALNAAGTDRAKFEAAHTALAGDKSMSHSDIKDVARQFRGGHVSSSKDTRADTLGAIRSSFTAHARFNAKLTTKGFDISVVKADPDQRKVFGWASVSAYDGNLVVDKQDDMIHTADLEKAAHEFTLYSRTQGDMHTDIGVGRMIESVIFDQAKREAGIIAKDDQGRVIDGWWVGFLVDDDGVWAAHKRGERPEFSIGGRAIREAVE